MSDDPEELNYDCTYNIFLARAFMPKLHNAQDRNKASRWLRRLNDSCCRSLDEMKLRNDIVYRLVLNIKKGVLEPPFDENPPAGSIESMANLLPGISEKGFPINRSTWEQVSTPTVINNQSIDNFLVPKPLPTIGAYCYLAVTSSMTDDEEDA